MGLSSTHPRAPFHPSNRTGERDSLLSSGVSVGDKEKRSESMDPRIADRYRERVIAVLEGLRTAVYSNCRLEDFTRKAPPKGEAPGWAIGLDTTDKAGERIFRAYVTVTVDVNVSGQPVQFVCEDDEGRVERTPKGDLSKEALVAALKRLHRRKEGQAWQVWRWLGHLSDTYGVET